VWIFEDELKDALEAAACDKTNEVLREATNDFEDAMFSRDFSMPLKTGGELEVDFTPSVITGGYSCAVIMTPASIQITGQPKTQEVVTPPFINIQDARVRRQARNWCSAVPGPTRGISVILTEDLVERFIQDLHHFDLLKFELEQSGSDGNSLTFDVSRNGRRLSTFQMELPASGDLAGLTLRSVKISSTAPPEVRITQSGISVKVNIRARVILFSEFPKLEVRTEFESLTEWRGTATLREKDGRYSLIPHVTASVDVWTGKLYLGAQRGGERRSGQRKMEEGNQILESIERLLNSVLEERLAQLLEEDVRSGIPLNIPLQYLTLRGADISYNEDYVLVSADNISIDLQ
jgi:hypothetical protein